jgi:integrase
MPGGGDCRLLSNAWPFCLRETLTADQAQALMAFLETYSGPTGRRAALQPKGFLVPFFALALFAGIRLDWKNGEIGKLLPRDLDFRTGVIRIEPGTSKVNERRTIKIQPNLRAWLEQYPLEPEK